MAHSAARIPNETPIPCWALVSCLQMVYPEKVRFEGSFKCRMNQTCTASDTSAGTPVHTSQPPPAPAESSRVTSPPMAKVTAVTTVFPDRGLPQIAAQSKKVR